MIPLGAEKEAFLAKKRSLHLWLEEGEHRRLEEVASDRGWSVAEVCRVAIRELLAAPRLSGKVAAENLCGLGLSLRPWSLLEEKLKNVTG